MTGLLARAAAAFVEPAPEAGPVAAALPRGARAVVLGRPADALRARRGAGRRAASTRAALAAAAARRLAGAKPPAPGAGVAGRPPSRRPPRTPAASRRSPADGWRGSRCRGQSRSAAACVRAEAATDGPTVVAVTGPRCDALDALLDDCDLVIWSFCRATPIPPSAELALAGLDGLPGAGRRVPAAVRSLRAPAGLGRAGEDAERAGVAARGCGGVGERLALTSRPGVVLLVGGLLAAVLGGLVLGPVARGVAQASSRSARPTWPRWRARDAMHDAYARLFEPATSTASRTRATSRRRAYLALGRAAAERVARANGAGASPSRSPTATRSPRSASASRCGSRFEVRAGAGSAAPITASGGGRAGAAGADGSPVAGGGGYDGPLAYRQGKPMRPDVARAFDRMEARGARRRDRPR